MKGAKEWETSGSRSEDKQKAQLQRPPRWRVPPDDEEDMSGEPPTNPVTTTAFHTAVHDFANASAADGPSGAQDADAALEEKRRKARERQRRKRERDRANAGIAPPRAVAGAEPMTDAEAQRAEIKKIKARERQRKHRELVRARRNQDNTSILPDAGQSHIPPVDPGPESAPVVPVANHIASHAHSTPSNSLEASNTSVPAHQVANSDSTFVEQASVTSQSLVSPASGPSKTGGSLPAGGDFFANALLSAVNRLPDLRNHLFDTLHMTEDDLLSFRGILAAQFNHWDDQRMRIARQIVGHVARVPASVESNLAPPRSNWTPATTNPNNPPSSSTLQPHTHPLTPLTPPSQPRTPSDARTSTVRRSTTNTSHTVGSTYNQSNQASAEAQDSRMWQQPSSAHGTAPATPHQQVRNTSQDVSQVQNTSNSSVQHTHQPPQMTYPHTVQHAALVAQQNLRPYHAPEGQIPAGISSQNTYASSSPVVIQSRPVHPGVGPTRVHHPSSNDVQDKNHRHQPY